jgi:DNA-binding MarR family transcriptional regulator
MRGKRPGFDKRTLAGREDNTSLEHQIEQVRRFTRFFTKRVGVLRRRFLGSAFSTTKARILWEIASREGSTAKFLAEELQLDNGYLSRLLNSLEKEEILRRERSPSDGRTNYLFLTERGRMAYEPLDERARRQAEAMLLLLSETERVQLIQAMQTIEKFLAYRRA